MRHIVFGAGLIGGFVGAMLAKQGQSVTLIGRDRVMARWQDGLRLTDFQGHQIKGIKPALMGEDWQQTPPECDVLWLTVKCTGVRQAAFDIKSLLTPQSQIFCCQNGLGADGQVRALYPWHPVSRVMVPFNVVEEEPGWLHRGSEGTLVLESSQNPSFVRQLAGILDNPMMPVSTTGQMDELLWAKLQLNLGNAINALADIPVKAMLQQRGFRRILASLMEELLTVADAKGLQLPRLTRLPPAWLPRALRLPDWLFIRLASRMLAIDPQVRTSMWWDLKQGRHTEISYLNGAVVEAALSLGLPCPYNQALVRLIQQAESGELSQGLGAGELQGMILAQMN
ncbi:2-dehydropantoate 2-reductase [Bowmanella dokdonensis]|uniref:2-dehydropantoate 2-reductase n=1 Tax=Bowmanella dokdonensis TaxID=751969 RepID=A0A939IS53_9ALTE|nr:2-dehydropantoate 2-reductase [Bowmanella dokdonensis]MBN7826814.1 2-dehydropantoate 2-reductase [Bowmanella dokdonensis]